MKEQQQNWTEIIDSKSNIFDFKLKVLCAYKDLLIMFVKRDFAATYKQTILGPLWFFIQPLLTTIMFTVVFGKFANLKTDIEPKFLFYLSGITIWNFFQDCLLKTATVFKDNSQLFGKVFFPRLIVPLSIVISSFLKFLVQFFLFILLICYYTNQNKIHPSIEVLYLPILIILMSGMALGVGLIITSLTTKYRDLSFLISFAVQLLMYASPIIYSLNTISPSFKKYILFNPLTGIIENFRNIFLGIASINFSSLMYSCFALCALILLGLMMFNKVEEKFIDTV